MGEYNPSEVAGRSTDFNANDNVNANAMPSVAGEGRDDTAMATGEGGNENVDRSNEERKPKNPRPAKKAKTQITMEQYQTIATAVATMLRSKEDDGKECTWAQSVEWYLEEQEGAIGDSEEELNRVKKLANLVIKKLVRTDGVLIFSGDKAEGEKDENRGLVVHPNYEISS